MVAVGSCEPGNVKAEYFEDNVWTSIPDYPVTESHICCLLCLVVIEFSTSEPVKQFLCQYATIFHKQNFYFFGGYSGDKTKMGYRTGHNEIYSLHEVGCSLKSGFLKIVNHSLYCEHPLETINLVYCWYFEQRPCRSRNNYDQQ